MPEQLQGARVADFPMRGLLAPQARELRRGMSGGVNVTLRGTVHLVDGSSQSAYVKLLSVRRLVNELVASQFARTLGLLAPTPFLVLVDAKDYPVLFSREQVTVPHLIGFGTTAILGNPLSKVLDLDDAVHADLFFKYLKQWQQVCAFDSWIGNEDRHRANVVLDDKFQVWAIDHDQSFGTDTPFSSLQFDLPRLNRFLQDNCGKLALRLKHEVSDVAQDLMKRGGILDVAGEIADSHAPVFLESSEVSAMALYIEKRLTIVDALICEALGIPKLLS
jgi:hypothetical protein